MSLSTPPSAERSPADGPVLAVEGLVVTAAGATDGTRRTLVRDVSFGIAPGKTLAIVGESGSGKSMTARAILGLLPQNVRSEGSIRFEDVEIVGARERDLRRLRGARLSLLLQDPFTMLNPLQSAFDTVAESLPRSLRRDRRLARDEVERRLLEVGVDPALAGRRYPFQLSGGMRQRVALAASLAKDPQVLIADEPTTALDVTTQRDVLELLAQLQRTRGMSLVLITHDLAVAFSVCDQVLVLYAGSTLEYGPSAVLAEHPAHPYTAKLRASSPPASHFLERLEAIPGTVPAADAVANQCAFAERCDWARPVCFSAHPIAKPVAEGHASACIRVDEIRSELPRDREAVGVGGAGARSPTAASALLEVDELRKSYRTVSLVGKSRTVEAVRGVSFRIDAGESLGLVGESGSGKTSIARCILGLSAPEAGRVRLEGTDITDYEALSRRQLALVRASVQMVFQDPYASLNPRLTIGSVLAEAVRARRVEQTDTAAEVAGLLQLVGLPEQYASRRPRALSGGERQRVAIARALAIQPRLLVCDEPVASLDVSVQAQILELLRDIRRQRATSMLFITHDLAVVRQMTERVIVLHDGQIVEEGPTAAVLDAPTHPYTQRLLASRVD